MGSFYALMEDIFPKKSWGMSLLLESNNWGYSFLYASAQLFYPTFIDGFTILLDDFPTKGETKSFNIWKLRVNFYQMIATFIYDTKMNLNKEVTQNKYIKHLYNHKAIKI